MNREGRSWARERWKRQRDRNRKHKDHRYSGKQQGEGAVEHSSRQQAGAVAHPIVAQPAAVVWSSGRLRRARMDITRKGKFDK